MFAMFSKLRFTAIKLSQGKQIKKIIDEFFFQLLKILPFTLHIMI